MRKTRNEGKGKKIMVYFMGIVMIGSVFGVIFWGGDTTSSVKEKGLKFTEKGNFWSTIIGGKEAMFTYVPSQVETINIGSNLIDRLKNRLEIDATSDFNDTFAEQISLAGYNMGITLNNFNIFVRQGFTAENEYNFPVITCEDATNSVPVIYFRSSNETKIYLEDNCVIAEASSENDLLGIGDRLVYGMLGVIE